MTTACPRARWVERASRYARPGVERAPRFHPGRDGSTSSAVVSADGIRRLCEVGLTDRPDSAILRQVRFAKLAYQGVHGGSASALPGRPSRRTSIATRRHLDTGSCRSALRVAAESSEPTTGHVRQGCRDGLAVKGMTPHRASGTPEGTERRAPIARRGHGSTRRGFILARETTTGRCPYPSHRSRISE